uniref:(northern house mosquito) hypothetical protein n=1 Tax=Culex pipiens TaxID=7175 RepID=A0A8D8DV68_CULPI
MLVRGRVEARAAPATARHRRKWQVPVQNVRPRVRHTDGPAKARKKARLPARVANPAGGNPRPADDRQKRAQVLQVSQVRQDIRQQVHLLRARANPRGDQNGRVQVSELSEAVRPTVPAAVASAGEA